MDVIIALVLIASIIIATIGIRQDKKAFKYVGGILIIVCLVCLFPDFIRVFIDGFRSGIVEP